MQTAEQGGEPRAAAWRATAAACPASAATRNYATCNAQQLITFLESDNAKALAWSRTLGIGVTDIRSYVSHLTPVILRTDTRVTNHGYVNGGGQPDPGGAAGRHGGVREQLRPAGREVLLRQPAHGADRGRRARLHRAAVGELLHYPHHDHREVDHGDPRLQALRPAHAHHLRAPGGHGRDQRLAARGIAAGHAHDPGSDSAPSAAAVADHAGAVRADGEPERVLVANPGHLGDNFTLSVSGFAPNTALVFELLRPDGVLERYSIHTDSSGHGSYTFTGTGTAISGTYTATVTNPNTGAHVSSSVQVQPA